VQTRKERAVARRRGLSIRPAEWLSDQRLDQLRPAELGALMRLAILAVENHDRGPFVADGGKPVSFTQLARMVHATDPTVTRALSSLVRLGLVLKGDDGAFRVAFLERDKSGGGVLVPSKVQKNSPLPPITPIPPEKKKREKRGRGAPDGWEDFLTEKLKAGKGVAEAWRSWVSHVTGLMRLTEEKLRQDVRRLSEIHDQVGDDGLVSAVSWAVSCGYRTITREPQQKPRIPPKNPQHSTPDEGDGFSARHRPNVL
jgi:DNA-binding MarR family transcriptional regulator